MSSRKGVGSMKKLKDIGLALIVPAFIVLAWWYVTNYTDTPNSILPKISEVGNTFRDMLKSGELQFNVWISLQRVFKGYLLSAVVGITLGTLLGMSRLAKKMLQPLFTTIRQIPIMAWIPLLILWCGIGEGSKVVIIFIASVFPILINTQAGISSTPASLLEVAQLYKLSKLHTFLRVYLPHALSGIQTGLKLGLGVSWMAVVAAELIASTSGIGYTMSYARTLMQSNVVILCMIVVGLIGILMDKMISLVFTLVTPWERINLTK